MKIIKISFLTFILFQVLLWGAGTVLQEPEENLVLTSMFFWYDEGRQWHWPIYDTPLKSVFGEKQPYYSGDVWLSEVQNEIKDKYGIGADLISWWGPGHWQEAYVLASYFNAANLYKRQYGILYEVTDLLIDSGSYCYDFNNPYNARLFKYHIQYLLDYFFDHPIRGKHALRIDGRPVVYIWTGNFQNFSAVSEEVREKVYLVGPEPIFFPPGGNEYSNDKERIKKLNCWDAIADFGMSCTYIAGKYGSLTVEAVEEYARAVTQWHRILSLYAPDTEWMLPILFNYHDNRGDTDPLTGKSRILNCTPEQAEIFMKAVKRLSEFTGYNKLNVTSWNEHYESSGIEPTEEHGYLWLELIKKYLIDDFSNRDKIKWRKK